MPVKKQNKKVAKKKVVSNPVVKIDLLNAAIDKTVGVERGAISEFSRKIGLSTASVSRVRAGETPGLANYVAIVRGLKRKLEDFIA